MIKRLNKGIKKFSVFDMALVKLAVAVFILFVISFLSGDFLDKIKELRWIWLALTIIFSIKPMIKVWK